MKAMPLVTESNIPIMVIYLKVVLYLEYHRNWNIIESNTGILFVCLFDGV